MLVRAYTRVSDLGNLPDLVAEAEGPSAVERIFDDQGVALAVLDLPDTPLLFSDCVGLYERASAITGERSFGLNVGSQLGFSSLGPFGQYVVAAPTLKAALLRARKCIVFHESYSKVELEQYEGNIKFAYQCSEQGSIGWRHLADMVVCAEINLLRHFLGAAWVPRCIEVSYRRGPWEQDLEDIFGVPVLFDKPAVAIVFDVDLLDTPNPHQLVSGIVLTLADVIQGSKSLPRDFLGACGITVRQRLMRGQSDLEGTAAALGITPRTLQRRLSEEGLSYGRVLANCRKERASNLLAKRSVSIGDISASLGYASQAHFTRAFKDWTGVTPREFRVALLVNT